MNESFLLYDLERQELENQSNIPNKDDITVCSWRGMCLRQKGRNACLCKAIEQYCTIACHRESKSECLNSREFLESYSSEDSADSDPYEQLLDNSENEDNEPLFDAVRTTRGRSRRGRNRSRRRGRRNRGITRGIGDEHGRSRSRERMQTQRGRGRARGGGRGRLVQEEHSERRLISHEQQIQNLVENLNQEVLRRLAVELLRRQPAVFADLVNRDLPVFQSQQSSQQNPDSQSQPDPFSQTSPDPLSNPDLQPDPESSSNPDPQPDPEPDPDMPAAGVPNWCNCGNCQIMPTQIENKCCCSKKMSCLTTAPLFQQLVLDGNVLDIAMQYREDVLAVDHPRNNENFRHAACGQFVLWQHGRLGKGNRRVVPSCCVLAIRARYPSPNGMYVGYHPSRL